VFISGLALYCKRSIVLIVALASRRRLLKSTCVVGADLRAFFLFSRAGSPRRQPAAATVVNTPSSFGSVGSVPSRFFFYLFSSAGRRRPELAEAPQPALGRPAALALQLGGLPVVSVGVAAAAAALAAAAGEDTGELAAHGAPLGRLLDVVVQVECESKRLETGRSLDRLKG
jgi:hypothetical protein